MKKLNLSWIDENGQLKKEDNLIKTIYIKITNGAIYVNGYELYKDALGYCTRKSSRSKYAHERFFGQNDIAKIEQELRR